MKTTLIHDMEVEIERLQKISFKLLEACLRIAKCDPDGRLDKHDARGFIIIAREAIAKDEGK